ncbi:hypothetical protein ACFQ45_06430 [Rhodanobacter aciditrophus]|uniref:Uncharacterized protein n=1 Tax=Rhodanobacter aciditrophus TaxID=1623218 RepID=A0ABW4B093_9GAMM
MATPYAKFFGVTANPAAAGFLAVENSIKAPCYKGVMCHAKMWITNLSTHFLQMTVMWIFEWVIHKTDHFFPISLEIFIKLGGLCILATHYERLSTNRTIVKITYPFVLTSG